jgi:hypothetical protein
MMIMILIMTDNFFMKGIHDLPSRRFLHINRHENHDFGESYPNWDKVGQNLYTSCPKYVPW